MAGRVSLYEGYFYFTVFSDPYQGVEAGHGAAEEEACGGCWEAQHHTRKRDQSFPIARGQAQSQRASMLRRLGGSRPQAPSTLCCVRATTCEFINHGQTRCRRQPQTRTIGERDEVRGCTGRARRPISIEWDAGAPRRGYGPDRFRCLIRDNQRAHV